jgi:HK97 family phage major capsid protein
MSFKLKGLRERRGKVRAELQKLGDRLRTEERAMSAEEQETFGKLKDEFSKLSEQVRTTEEQLKALDDLTGGEGDDGGGDGAGDTDPVQENARRIPGKQDRSGRRAGGDGASAADTAKYRKLAFQAWARRQYGKGLTHEHAEACKRAGVNPGAKTFRFKLGNRPHYRAMDVSTTTGGDLIAPDFSKVLERYLKDFSSVRGVCDEFRTATGVSLPYPYVDDTSNVGELLGINTEVAYQDVATNFLTFAAYKYSSKGILVAHELLNDSFFDLESLIGELAGERLGRIQGTHFTTGTGTSQPQGIVNCTTGVTAGSTTAFTVDDLVNLVHSINPAYRGAPSFGLMGNDTVLAYLALMKDGQGRPLFAQSFREGSPDTVYGYKWHPNQFMDSAFTTGKKLIVAGDFSKFKIRDVEEVRIRRLDERWAEKDQVGFIAFMRSDSRIVNTAALRKLVLA